MSKPIGSFDEQAVKDELRELVGKTIEETINAMLDEEADQLVGAGPYERADERAAYRAGHYERGFTTTSGQVTLKMPKLKGMRFATAVIERYKRRETSVEEAIIEMHLAGVSTRRIRANSTVERLNREIRRRTRVVGTFPDGKSALMLVASRLKYVADSEWGSRRYLDASLLKE
ncbi:transposase [Senegalimassilia anaerobia]